jgi:hypothetical protein
VCDELPLIFHRLEIKEYRLPRVMREVHE